LTPRRSLAAPGNCQARHLTAELLALIENRQDDVICISALLPYAFPPARTICKLIRERFPKLKPVIGVWGFSGDTEKAKTRFERTQPDRLFTSPT
jgi:hypothetical protein